MSRTAPDFTVLNGRFGCLWAAAFVVTFAVGLGWWVLIGGTTPPVRFNCRLTLSVATPQGERVGSGVVEIYREYASLADQAFGYAASTETLGEAVSIDLGADGFIFVVLANDPDRFQSRDPSFSRIRPYDPFDRMVTTVFPEDRFHGTWPAGKRPQNLDEAKTQWKAYAAALENAKPKADVPLGDLPMIVRFRDIYDPATIQRVYPTYLEGVFGTGVTLERATLAITADPVTRGIDKMLPWLEHDEPRSHFPPPLSSHTAEQNLGSYAFKSYGMPE